MKHKYLYILILLAAVASACLLTRKCSRPAEVVHEVHITDTVTDVEFDTVFFEKVDTGWLHTTDSVYVWKDSLLVLVDSVQVEVPIYCYRTDTVFENDSVRLKIGVECSGYDVVLDRLYYDLQYKYYTVQPPKKRNRLGVFVGPSFGVGWDVTTGKVVPAVGFSVGVGITFKKW